MPARPVRGNSEGLADVLGWFPFREELAGELIPLALDPGSGKCPANAAEVLDVVRVTLQEFGVVEHPAGYKPVGDPDRPLLSAQVDVGRRIRQHPVDKQRFQPAVADATGISRQPHRRHDPVHGRPIRALQLRVLVVADALSLVDQDVVSLGAEIVVDGLDIRQVAELQDATVLERPLVVLFTPVGLAVEELVGAWDGSAYAGQLAECLANEQAVTAGVLQTPLDGIGQESVSLAPTTSTTKHHGIFRGVQKLRLLRLCDPPQLDAESPALTGVVGLSPYRPAFVYDRQQADDLKQQLGQGGVLLVSQGRTSDLMVLGVKNLVRVLWSV